MTLTPQTSTLTPKIIAIVGPTSSGKSELAVSLAKHFNGEIISADSRQIYRGMDLGTGKVTGHWMQYSPPFKGGIRGGYKKSIYLYKSIPHHLIDFVNPAKQYSVARFQRDAKKAIKDILKRGHLPIICGGTAHWIDAVVYNQEIPDVKPNPKLRARLEKLTAETLFARIVTKDPERAKTIDRHNKRRLIRALEIIEATGKPVPVLSQSANQPVSHNTLWLGITVDQKTLYKKIDVRLKQRIKQGMIKEVESLHKNGLSWKKLEAFGLEYKFVSLFLQKKITKDEMFTQLFFAIQHYTKRQMTWWKRNKEIVWIKPDVTKAVNLTKKFLK